MYWNIIYVGNILTAFFSAPIEADIGHTDTIEQLADLPTAIARINELGLRPSDELDLPDGVNITWQLTTT
jgi:hypothetical protein